MQSVDLCGRTSLPSKFPRMFAAQAFWYELVVSEPELGQPWLLLFWLTDGNNVAQKGRCDLYV